MILKFNIYEIEISAKLTQIILKLLLIQIRAKKFESTFTVSKMLNNYFNTHLRQIANFLKKKKGGKRF